MSTSLYGVVDINKRFMLKEPEGKLETLLCDGGYVADYEIHWRLTSQQRQSLFELLKHIKLNKFKSFGDTSILAPNKVKELHKLLTGKLADLNKNGSRLGDPLTAQLWRDSSGICVLGYFAARDAGFYISE